MKEKEEEYRKPISILSNFNFRTGILATQISALNNALYSPVLASAAISLVKEYKALSPLADLLPRLDVSIHSSVTAIARDANLAISSLTKNENVLELASIVSAKPLSWLNGIDSIHSQSPISGITQAIAQSVRGDVSALRIGSMDPMRISSPLVDQFNVSALGIESNFSKLSATSILAESALSAFKWSGLGVEIGIGQSAKLRLSDSFVAVSESYSDLFKSIQIVPQSIIDCNPSIIRRTPIEYYTGAELCRIISIPDKPAVEKELFSNQILIGNRMALERNLPRIHSDLFNLWDGANQALTSPNPDRVRHFCSSFRELMTNVLHHLSPDDGVKKWSSNPSFYRDGRPTREARLMYICRDINMGPFQKFVQKDVAATIEFIDLFHEGTHKIKSSFTEEQLLALKAKAESTLAFLMEIGLTDT